MDLFRKESDEQPYAFTVPEGYKDASDLAISIRFQSAEVTYHYRRGG